MKINFKPVVLGTVGVVTTMGVTAALTRAVKAGIPWFENDDYEDMNKKEILINIATTIGITVAIALVAGSIANQATLLVDSTFWKEDGIEEL